jgi:hypothetical protein
MAAADAAAAARAAPLDFEDIDGAQQSPPDLSKSTAIVVATWCPHSKRYVEFIRTMIAKGNLSSNSVAFVLTDEREHLAKEAKSAVESGKITDARYAEIAEQYHFDDPSFWPVFFDEDVLRNLPAASYITDFPEGMDPEAVPARLISTSGETDDSYIEGIKLRTTMPQNDFYRELVMAYPELQDVITSASGAIQ